MHLRLRVELGDRAAFAHNATIVEIGHKISKAVEDVLEVTVPIPNKKGHWADGLNPTYPIRIVDNGYKMEE